MKQCTICNEQFSHFDPSRNQCPSCVDKIVEKRERKEDEKREEAFLEKAKQTAKKYNISLLEAFALLKK